MSVYGSVEQGFISKLISACSKTSGGLSDMRGFDWSHVHKDRPHYYEGHIFRVDFSNSKSDYGFCVTGAVFEECIFDKSIWWMMWFIKCKFIKCSFNNCCFYNSTLGGEFYSCSFKNLTTKGERFTFGRGFYEDCIFESVHLRKIGEVIAVRFERCKFDGIFSGDLEGGVFRGRKYALMRRLDSVMDIFDSRNSPVRFIDCDLTGLKTENVIFEKDIVLKDCKFNPDIFAQTK